MARFSFTLRATREHRGHELCLRPLIDPLIQAISFLDCAGSRHAQDPRDHWSALRALRWLTALDDEVLTQE
jgi:hypothetical protein